MHSRIRRPDSRAALDRMVLALRDPDHPLACRVIAARLGITEGQVCSILRRYKRTHEFRAPLPPRRGVPHQTRDLLEAMIHNDCLALLARPIAGSHDVATVEPLLDRDIPVYEALGSVQMRHAAESRANEVSA